MLGALVHLAEPTLDIICLIITNAGVGREEEQGDKGYRGDFQRQKWQLIPNGI